MFEKISEDEMEERLTGRRSKGRWSKMAEKKRIAQELARRATESKYRKRLEQQGTGISRSVCSWFINWSCGWVTGMVVGLRWG